ncbi:MAG: cytochrome P450 [Rhodospirillales bacterium]|nr:cytochrome P450 [Rhodospirillales bacterium]
MTATVATAETPPELDFDPFAREFLDDPWPGLARARETAPVVRLGRYGCLAIGRHGEIAAMLADWQSYPSARGVGIRDYKTEAPLRGPSLLLETDPPMHTPRRAVLSRVLSSAALRALRPRLEAAAEALADRVAASGTIEAIGGIAEAYPLRVFPDALGMAEDGRECLLPYGDFVFNSMGPHNDLLAAALARLPPLNEWLIRQTRREALAPDGFGQAIYAAADRGEIAPEEAPLLVRALLSAGVDTTVSGIGAALYCLAAHPGEWAKLRANPTLARAAFEEAVRHETPVQSFFRTTARAVELGGFRIAEGSKILMLFAAANRDPRRWDDPDRYDISRNPSGHLAFGAGIHMCVGQVLARMEGEAVLAALARRIARIEIAGEPVWRHNNTLRRLGRLPLRLVAA